MTNTIDVTIDAVGSRGDGLARAPDGTALFVPLTVPGDRVRVRSGKARARNPRGLTRPFVVV
jgi:23S rRNA (uracil1939-C5)-methyltransferase